MATQQSIQPFSVEQPQRVSLSSFEIPPRNFAHADVLNPELGASAPFSSRFVVRLMNRRHLTAYLHAYTEKGVCRTFDLARAKLFIDFQTAQRIATLFYAEVVRVVTDGQIVRLALLEPRLVPQGRRLEEKTETGAGLPKIEDSGSPFFIARRRIPHSPGEQLLIEFLENYLSQPGYDFRFQGVQKGFAAGSSSGLLLFAGPETIVGNCRASTTLAIEANLLDKPRSEILEVIRLKLDASRAAFSRGKQVAQKQETILESEVEEDAGASGAAIAWG
jgi:hypothetical protein